eukprot:CCRYP_020432-RA/>CCRYP_020432-RA protein AED:0.01 eAED:0.01 QI:1070/1/1/1/0/0/2/821/496
MQISLKQVLNAPLSISGSKRRNQFASHAAIKSSGKSRSQKYGTISTLTVDAAVLRRDLYRYLVELESIGFIATMQSVEVCRGESISDNESMILKLTSRLLSTLEHFSSSPSIRLYIVLSLDHLRELHLGVRGYQGFLDQLLNTLNRYDCANERKDLYLKLYTEIVSECDLYAKPKHLLSALSMLMAMALRYSQGNTWGALLQTISHIMLRRRNILLRFNEDDVQQNSELKRFVGLANKMSFEYGSSSFWIHQSMNREQQEELVAILQATGILSLFGIDSEDDGYSPFSKDTQFPYPDHLSLRSAHARLGPCPGYNNILTHPLAYNYASVFKSPDSKVQHSCGQKHAPPPPYVDYDILNVIFDFLGYRSLARASQCCQAWRDASKSNIRWSRLYFYKFPGDVLEEEVEFNSISHHIVPLDPRLSRLEDRIAFPKSLVEYDWHFLFRKKYFTEKMARARSLGKPTRFQSCRFVGCHELLKERHLVAHWKNMPRMQICN